MKRCDCCSNLSPVLYYSPNQSYRWCAECYWEEKQEKVEQRYDRQQDPIARYLNKRR